MANPYEGNSNKQGVPGIRGVNSAAGDGVFGFANLNGRGVVGVSENATGVQGNSGAGVGVWGESDNVEGVHGVAKTGFAGVGGYNEGGGSGVWGEATSEVSGEGVTGHSHSTFAGVAGYNIKRGGAGPGVWGESNLFHGVHGVSHSQAHAGVSGANDRGGPAGFFGGNVIVTGTISAAGTDLLNAIQQLSAKVQTLQEQVGPVAAQISTLQIEIATLSNGISALAG